MVKRFDYVYISEDDKRLAKSAASLKGMKLSEYLGERIREDARKDLSRINEELKERTMTVKRRPTIGFFQK